MARILVVGASGLLGAELLLAAAESHTVVGVSNQHSIRPPAEVVAVSADLAQPGVAARLMTAYRPEWAVNAAAATDVDRLEHEPERADAANRLLPLNLAVACRESGARLVHISTEAVFDGHGQRPYRENDAPRPRNVYAASKLAGEQAVADAAPDALIVRTTLYGWNAQPKLSLAEWFLSRLDDGDDPPGFVDTWFTPINTAHAARLLIELLGKGAAPGVYHLPGADCVTKYDFARHVARAFGHDPGRIRAMRQADIPGRAHRAAWACLDGTKLSLAVGAALPTVREGIDRLLRDHRSGRRGALRHMGGQV